MHTPPRGASKSTIMSAARALIHPTRGSLSRLASFLDSFRVARPSPALPARRLLHPRRRGHLVRRAPNLRRRGGLDPPRVRRATLARAVPRISSSRPATPSRPSPSRRAGHPRTAPRATVPPRPSSLVDATTATSRSACARPRPPDPPRRRRSNPTRPRIRSLSHPPAFLRRGRRQRRRRRPRERRRRGDGSRRRARRRRSMGSVRGAKLRVSTGGGALVASNLTADAVIRTDGGALDVGKLVGRRLRVRTLGGDARVEDALRGRTRPRHRGRNARLKTLHVSRYGRVRTSGGILHRAERGGTERNERRWTRGRGRGD